MNEDLRKVLQALYELEQSKPRPFGYHASQVARVIDVNRHQVNSLLYDLKDLGYVRIKKHKLSGSKMPATEYFQVKAQGKDYLNDLAPKQQIPDPAMSSVTGSKLNKHSREVLEYLYRQRADNHLNSATLIELPNTDGVNDLYHKGYLNIDFSKDRSIKSISINGKGLDWIHANTVNESIQVSAADINDDVIALKIRAELYAHIEKYLKTDDYFHAVEESYKFVRRRLKNLTGSEKATQAFGYEANNNVDNVQIFGHEPVDEIEADFFKGIRFLHLSVQFLRNEKSHSLATTLDRNLALHYISIASLAYDLISRQLTEHTQ